MKIKLSGQYFQLRNYLAQLEQLSWTFFWQDFHLQVKDYPLNEVDITIYSLGAEKEFVGV
jgi:MSHA biogenesis protein MshJ